MSDFLAWWQNWFEQQDLRHLEDVRWYVESHTLDNVSDVPEKDRKECAKATVEQYLDDSEAAEVFEYYRK